MYSVHKMYRVNMHRGVCVYTRLFVCMCASTPQLLSGFQQQTLVLYAYFKFLNKYLFAGG